jgi:lipoprotein-releasing system ATP-binding protein
MGIEAGRFTLISGDAESGAGALLRILGLLERADAGEMWIEGQATSALDDGARLECRNHMYGFLFAEPFLLESFTVAENVAMPLFKISGLDIEQARVRTAQVLEFANLAGAADAGMHELSALDQHKVALARALANAPQVLIAEDAGEQLGAGDFREFAGLLKAAAEQMGVAVIATSASGREGLTPDREVRLENGLIAGDTCPVAIEAGPVRES